MSRMSFERALGIVAERTYYNKMDIRQKNVQRRNAPEDLYGVPYYARSGDDNSASFYISVSNDKIYYNRFQFRLAVHEAGEGDFKIYIHGKKGKVYNITDYLKEQHGNDWIEGEGLYPKNLNYNDPETADLDEGDVFDFYDLLDVAQMIQAEADTLDDGDTRKDELLDEREDIMDSGWKQIEITSDSPFEVTMFLYVKYNQLNR